MSAKAIVRMPGEGKELKLAGEPLRLLVVGEDTKHTSMFDWTLPSNFSTASWALSVRSAPVGLSVWLPILNSLSLFMKASASAGLRPFACAALRK